jgi:hypothetical protein
MSKTDVTPGAGDVQSTPYQRLYLKERRKSQLLMGSSGLLLVVLVGALLFHPFSNKPAAPTGLRGRAGGAPQFGQMGQRGGMGGGFAATAVTDYFNADGSVNTDKVKALFSNLPGNGSSRIVTRLTTDIDAAIYEKKITEDQGTKLKAEITNQAGSTTSSDSGSGDNSGA